MAQSVQTRKPDIREVLRKPGDLMRVLRKQPSLLDRISVPEIRKALSAMPSPRKRPGSSTLSLRCDQYCVDGKNVVKKEGKNGSATTSILGKLVSVFDTSHITGDLEAGKSAQKELEAQRERTGNPNLKMIQLTTDVYTNTAQYAIYKLQN